MAAHHEAYIPYGGYWSTPFARWQMSLAHLHSIRFAATSAAHALHARGIPLDQLDHGVLGLTVPQEKSFWGMPWLASLIGAHHVTGPTISQACATSARCLAAARDEIARGDASASLVIACDRTSNSPVVLYPDPTAPGGAPRVETWVLDNFRQDPHARVAMVETAENCARRWHISTEEQHGLVQRRYEQYGAALADDAAFQRRYMITPCAVPDSQFKRTTREIVGDEGIHATTAVGLAKLKPVIEGGTVTFGGQTHPADGNAGMIVTTKDKARALSRDSAIQIRLLAFGQAREEVAFMPAAPVKAARRALEAANLSLRDISAIKSHNPFIVNDIVFARETGADPSRMNNFGCSLVYGHPQGPTGLRIIIELIEELTLKGGGLGLFHGCAAGDTAMSVVLEVSDARHG